VGRPQTIFVDRDVLLANVCRLWNAALDAFDEPIADGQRRVAIADADERKAWKACEADLHNPVVREKHLVAIRNRREEESYLAHQQKKRDSILTHWLAYDLHAITGRTDLSPSVRLRVNQALRSLEADGLVDIEGRRAVAICPTPAGLARAKELQEAAGNAS
jgi:hypothetical protein